MINFSLTESVITKDQITIAQTINQNKLKKIKKFFFLTSFFFGAVLFCMILGFFLSNDYKDFFNISAIGVFGLIILNCYYIPSSNDHLHLIYMINGKEFCDKSNLIFCNIEENDYNKIKTLSVLNPKIYDYCKAVYLERNFCKADLIAISEIASNEKAKKIKNDLKTLFRCE